MIMSPYLKVPQGLVTHFRFDPAQNEPGWQFDEVPTWKVSSRVKASYHGDNSHGNGLVHFSAEKQGTIISGSGKAPSVAMNWWTIREPVANILAWGLDGYKLCPNAHPDNIVFEVADIDYTGCTRKRWEATEGRSYKVAIAVFSHVESSVCRISGKRWVTWHDRRGWTYEPHKPRKFRVIDLKREDGLFLGVIVLRAIDRPTSSAGSGYVMLSRQGPTEDDGLVSCLSAHYPPPQREDGTAWDVPSLDYQP